MRLKGSSPASLPVLSYVGSPEGSIVGGIPGRAATVTAGTTTTGSVGSEASVVNSGSYSEAVLDFTIPRGEAGPQGAPGTPGSVTIAGLGDSTTISRLVASTGTTQINQWKKIATYFPATNYRLFSGVYCVSEYYQGQTIFSVVAGRAAPGVQTLIIDVISKGVGTKIPENGIKLVSDGPDQQIELWVRSNGSGSGMNFWELSRHSTVDVTYEPANVGWTATEPVGTYSNVTSGPVTINGQLVVTHDAATFPSTLVTTTGAQTLTNKTLTSPTINTANIKTLKSHNISWADNQNLAYYVDDSCSRSLGFGPGARFYHDVFRWNWATNGVAPTREIFDGTSWTVGDPTPSLFTGRDGMSAAVVTNGTTIIGSRWTWSGGQLWGAAISYFAVGMTYAGGTVNTTFLIETSNDGVTWTTTHSSTGSTNQGGVELLAIPVRYDSKMRLTITSTNPNGVSVSHIEGLTLRPGNQGGGREFEYPYTWNTLGDITSRGDLNSTGNINQAGVPVVTTTGVQVLTNKTLTSPTLNAPITADIRGSNGTRVAYFSGVASGVNWVNLQNNSAGGAPSVYAQGPDTDINLNLFAKGSGTVHADGNPVATTTGAQTLTNKTLTSPTITGPRVNAISDTNGNIAINFNGRASAVNHITVGNNQSGSWPDISAVGASPDIGLNIFAKGAGFIQLLTSGVAAAQFLSVPGAVNYLKFSPSTTGNAVTVRGDGSDANVNLDLTTKGSGTVQANGNPVGVKVPVPATATSTGVAGQWAADNSYHYVCTATNTWRRAALSTW